MRNGPYELVVAPADFPGMKYRGRYVYEHHLVWWRATGNLVPADHVVHHVNGRKRDNRFCNLRLEGRAEHSAQHNAERPKRPPVSVICGLCGEAFQMSRRHYQTRSKQTKSGRLFCCKSHQVTYQQAQQRQRRLEGLTTLKPKPEEVT